MKTTYNWMQQQELIIKRKITFFFLQYISHNEEVKNNELRFFFLHLITLV